MRRRKGEIVRAVGVAYRVDMTAPFGLSVWSSSGTRNRKGGGACEYCLPAALMAKSSLLPRDRTRTSYRSTFMVD